MPVIKSSSDDRPYVKAWEWRKPYPPDRRYSMFDRRFPGGVLIITGWAPCP